MSMKSMIASCIALYGMMISCSVAGEGLDRNRSDLDADVESMLSSIRHEPNLTVRFTRAVDMSSILRSLPRSELQGLDCDTVNGFVAEFENQPLAVKAYFARVLGEMGGRAGASLPALRAALAQEKKLNVPNEFGTYPSVRHVADYESAIAKIEGDTIAQPCN